MGWTLIQHTALTSSAASVTLGSGGTIPQTYKTLKLVVSARSDLAANYHNFFSVEFNGSASGISQRKIEGYGGGTVGSNSGTTNTGTVPAAGATASTFGNYEITIPNYSSTTANKPTSTDLVTENNASGTYSADAWLQAGLWSNNSAISSIALLVQNSANFVSGSTFTLYGLS